MFRPIICLILFHFRLLMLAIPPSPAFIAVSTRAAAAPTTDISAPTGDTLNRSACFCASPQWHVDRTYGYAHHLAYYNAHLDHTFTLDPACRSALSVNVQERYDPKDKPVMQNDCLRSRLDDPVKLCTGKDSDVDTFCYTLAGGPGVDSYSFNGQHRVGLPKHPAIHYPEDVVERVCEESCREHVEGMGMLKADALEVLEGYYDLVGVNLESSVVFYPSIPDMCDGCK